MADASEWDERYGQLEMVWSVGPNLWVEQVATGLPVGRALDLAAGEGRNSLWLVGLGWQATAVDFSRVGLDRAEQLAVRRLGEAAGRFTTVCADLLDYLPTQGAYDLVLMAYLQVPAHERRDIVRTAASAVAPAGRLFVVAHDSQNLQHGYAGPQDPAVLYSADDVVADLEGTGVVVERAERVVRLVETVDGRREALDSLVLARR